LMRENNRWEIFDVSTKKKIGFICYELGLSHKAYDACILHCIAGVFVTATFNRV
jgi:hypothetical protein